MWYLATLLFAQPPRPDGTPVVCETSVVLIEADSALAAHDKAQDWGERRRVHAPGFDLVGIQHLKPLLLDRPPRDGDELDGRVFESEDAWQRVTELIPKKEELAAVYLEQNPGAKLGDVLSADERRLVLRVLEGS